MGGLFRIMSRQRLLPKKKHNFYNITQYLFRASSSPQEYKKITLKNKIDEDKISDCDTVINRLSRRIKRNASLFFSFYYITDQMVEKLRNSPIKNNHLRSLTINDSQYKVRII